MAVGVVTVQKQGAIANMKYAVVDVVGAASYTTTGDALDLNAICGFTNIYMVDANLQAPVPAVNVPNISYDKTNKKLQIFGTAAGVTGLTESSAATNLSGQTYRLFVLGS